MYLIVFDKLTNEIASILRTEDNAGIPIDENNVDYQAYLKWVENGNTPGVWEDEQ